MKGLVKYMSKWEDFKQKMGVLADKTAQKTRELTDTAALKLKIANKEADRDIEYAKLGKLAYAKLKELEGVDPEELTASISASLEKLDTILAELEALKTEDEERKAAKEAAKETARAAKEEDDDELDMKVMDEFKDARREADEKYEEAKAEADKAKAESDEAKDKKDE